MVLLALSVSITGVAAQDVAERRGHQFLARYADEEATGERARAELLQALYGGIHVIHGQGDMTVGVSTLVFAATPVVGELDHAVIGLTAVAQKGERELAVRVVLAAQHVHTENLGVEAQGAIQVAHAQHGVQKAARQCCLNFGCHVCAP